MKPDVTIEERPDSTKPVVEAEPWDEAPQDTDFELPQRQPDCDGESCEVCQ